MRSVLRGLLRLVGRFVAFAIGFGVAPSHGSANFFATTAQVVPVLLLVLAWEADVFRWRPDMPVFPSFARWRDAAAPADSWWHFFTRGLVFLAMIYAEILSLRGVSGEAISELDVRVICGAIVASFGGIAALTMLPRPPGTRERPDSAGSGRTHAP